jgi:hypothetical protein
MSLISELRFLQTTFLATVHFFSAPSRRVLANNDVDYIISPPFIFTKPESYMAACIRNDTTLTLIYPSMPNTLSVPSCDSPLACPHLSATV